MLPSGWGRKVEKRRDMRGAGIGGVWHCLPERWKPARDVTLPPLWAPGCRDACLMHCWPDSPTPSNLRIELQLLEASLEVQFGGRKVGLKLNRQAPEVAAGRPSPWQARGLRSPVVLILPRQALYLHTSLPRQKTPVVPALCQVCALPGVCQALQQL